MDIDGLSETLCQMLVFDEGIKLTPYMDSEGVLTIGCGRNLRDKGIRKSEAMVMLQNDITEAMSACLKKLPWIGGLDETRQIVLINMAYNMGIGSAKTGKGLLGFKDMLAAVKAGDYELAAFEMEDSGWQKQTGNRAKRLIAMMRTGQMHPDYRIT
jgi:lysozyme